MPSPLMPRLVELLADVLMLEDPSRVQPEARLVADLGAESIHVAEIAVALENEFGVPVPDQALMEVRTVGELLALVEGAGGS